MKYWKYSSFLNNIDNFTATARNGCTTFTKSKSLAQILSRDIGFNDIGHTERLFQNLDYPNPNIAHHPNPNRNPNPSRREQNIRFTGWSRDQISFCPYAITS